MSRCVRRDGRGLTRRGFAAAAGVQAASLAGWLVPVLVLALKPLAS
ncbi:hypothetical protein [Actinacidiphila sp. bgisy160]